MGNILPSINLLKKERKPILDTFLHWALTIGRLVVMLTEIIALTTFLYRFSLDRQIVDLHDKIKQKQTIVSLLKSDENTYRNLQNRLALITKFQDSSSETVQLLQNITSLTPQDIIINTLTVSDKDIKITANTRTLSSLTSFIKDLKSYKKVNSISLDMIENKISLASIGVSLTITLK